MASFLLFGFHLTIIFLFSYWMWRNQNLEMRPYFWPALVLKLSAGVGLGLLYKYHYSVGDTFTFFDDARKLTAIFWKAPGTYLHFLLVGDEMDPVWNLLENTQSRSVFLVKIVSVANLVSGDNYWITSLYFSLLSFWAAFLLFKKIVTTFPNSTLAAAIAFLFFPSVVFWSAGLIKESLAMAGLLVLSGIYLSVISNSKLRWWEWFLALIAVAVVWKLKYYWLAVFIPVTVTTLLVHFATGNLNLKSRTKIVVWIVLFSIFCLGVTLIHPNFYLERFLHVLVENNREFIRISPPENVIDYQLETSWWSIIVNAPWALFSGFFRPFIWETTNLLQMIVAAENFFIFILFVVTLFQIKTIGQSQNRLLIFSVVAYTVILCLFLSLSTPNFGTLARYKVGFLPFLIYMLLANNQKLDRIQLTLKHIFGKLF